MNREYLDYTSVEVDERLLVFETYAKRLFIAQNPEMADVDDQIIRGVLLRTHEMFGHARRTKGPDGRVRLEPTEKYLKYILAS